MKLKRIFMTGVLATSVLALSACGDEEEKPVEQIEEEPTEEEPAEEEPFKYSEALNVLGDLSAESFVNKFITDYVGDASYLLAKSTKTVYTSKTNEDGTKSRVVKDVYNGNHIYTLEDICKAYAIVKDSNNGINFAYANNGGIINEVANDSKNDMHQTYPLVRIDEDDNPIVQMINGFASKLLFKGNPLTSAQEYAKIADKYKNKVVDYLKGKVITDENGKESLDFKGMISEKTPKIDAAQALALLSPIMTTSSKTTAEIHEENPYAFLKGAISLSPFSISVSLDKDLLNEVLNDNKGKTLSSVLASAYGIEEEALLGMIFSEDIVGYSQMIASMAGGFDVLALLQMKLTQTINDSFIEKVNYLDFDVKLTPNNDGKFDDYAFKVTAPIDMENPENGQLETTPMGIYFAANKGDYFATVGMDSFLPVDKDNKLEAAKSYGVKEELIADFMTSIYPMGSAVYTANPDDKTKGTLDISFGEFMFSLDIINGESQFDVAINQPKFDENGFVYDDENNLVYEKVGALTYTKGTPNLSVYYNNFVLETDKNGLHAGFETDNDDYSYATIDLVLNQDDTIFDATMNCYSAKPEEGAKVELVFVEHAGAYKVENGYRFEYSDEDDNSVMGGSVTITKDMVNENPIYYVDFVSNTFSSSKTEIKEKTEYNKFVVDYANLTFKYQDYTNRDEYAVAEDGTKTLVSHVENGDGKTIEIILDKENKKLNITEDKTNSKGEISSNDVITVEFAKDEELKNSVIEEINQAITANSVYNLTVSDAELNKANESYASVDVCYGDDIYRGMIDDPSFTVNNKDHEVAITGDLSYSLGGTYYSEEFVLNDLSLKGVIEGKLDLTQYVYEKNHNRLQLSVSSIKINDISFNQSFNYNDVKYTVVYKDDKYVIYDTDLNDVTKDFEDIAIVKNQLDYNINYVDQALEDIKDDNLINAIKFYIA